MIAHFGGKDIFSKVNHIKPFHGYPLVDHPDKPAGQTKWAALFRLPCKSDEPNRYQRGFARTGGQAYCFGGIAFRELFERSLLPRKRAFFCERTKCLREIYQSVSSRYQVRLPGPGYEVRKVSILLIHQFS